MRGSEKNTGLFIFVIFLGGICGSLVGDILGSHVKMLEFLKKIHSIGTSSPLVLNLKVLTMSFGVNFNINLMSIIGIIVAIILYRKR